jgi:hypothetical protein
VGTAIDAAEVTPQMGACQDRGVEASRPAPRRPEPARRLPEPFYSLVVSGRPTWRSNAERWVFSAPFSGA